MSNEVKITSADALKALEQNKTAEVLWRNKAITLLRMIGGECDFDFLIKECKQHAEDGQSIC